MVNCVAPVEGILGAYTGNSFAVQASIASILGCALYGGIELVVLILSTFRVYTGLYFWSLLVSTSLGVIPYALGLLLKYFQLAPIWIPVTISTAGWCITVTGQSLVLYSRLHLVVFNATILRCVLGMIVFNAIAFQVPQITASYGAIYDCESRFPHFFNLWEKVQLTVFFVQEVIISSIFIVQTIKLLRLYPTRSKRKTNIMYQLLAINTLIIFMDTALITLQFQGLFISQTVLKCFFYAVKLKLETVVLSRLATFSRSNLAEQSSSLSQ